MSIATTIPSMTSEVVLSALREAGQDWQGHGCAVECGCWLGASAVALLSGLVDAGYDRPFWAFDRWDAHPSQVRKAAAAGVTLTLGENVRPRFLANVLAVYADVVATRGRADRATWRGPEIEVFVLDCAKAEPQFTAVMRTFGPHLVDGALVALLDARYFEQFDGARRDELECQARFIERCGAAFTEIRRFEGRAPAFYRYTGGLDWAGL